MTALPTAIRGIVWTSFAMLAFAGNSVICRLALTSGSIDPASFTSMRLFSGALTSLAIVSVARRGGARQSGGSWWSAVALFAYALGFSFAYVDLGTGTGALILFIAVALRGRERRAST